MPFGIINGFVQTIISFINFFILYFAFDVKGQNMYAIHQFQTAYFLESILTHIVIILVYRTELISFIQSIPSKEMVIGMLFFACLPFMIIFADLNTGDLFNFNLGKSNFY